MELSIDVGDVILPATVDMPPDGPACGGVVVLHGSAMPRREYFLYEHAAGVLARAGLAVLRFDRRPRECGDVPFAVQAGDAAAASARLRGLIGAVPVGLWAWSQGTWPASAFAARRPDLVAFLVLVATSGVSPGAQMRYATARQLVSHGYGDADLAELIRLRDALEGAVRGHVDRASAQAIVDRYAGRPWFPLAHVPRDLLGYPSTWDDMDHDPEPVIARVSCPTLLFYGETDEWTPAEESIAVWRRVAGTDDLTVHRLAGCTHTPTRGGAGTMESVSADYTTTLVDWVGERIRR
jgi:pimeloyl-ACP methyl ester carboxylesterase